MKVLVIYQNIPESTNVHIIEADGEDLEILKKCHNCYVNAGDMTDEQEKATDKLNFFLSKPEYIDEEFANQVALPVGEGAKWWGTMMDDSNPIDLSKYNVDLVVCTGFLM